MTVLQATEIRLGGCCPALPGLYEQLSSGRYDWPASILRLDDHDGYLVDHRTARKRAARASRLGYSFDRIERSDHIDDIHEINTSLPMRQGRPMSASYTERPSFTPLPEYVCERHRIESYGVFSPAGSLVAYLVMYVSGDMAMISQILGHGDHLANDVMYLLVLEALKETPLPVTVFYNRWDSGSDGLRFFKERLGFAPERVAWAA